MKTFLKIFLFVELLFLTNVINVQAIYGLFSDSGQSTGNTFQAAAVFPSPTPAFADHLVISEVLYDISGAQQINGQGGSNRGEWVEIYNPTAGSVSLSGWTLSDGDSSENLSGTLNPGSFLIVTGATESEFEAVWTVPGTVIYNQAGGGTIGNGLANGGDVITLKNGSTSIDSMSWGTDTTGFLTGCTGSCPTAPTGQSLERSPISQDTNSASNFIVNNPPEPGL